MIITSETKNNPPPPWVKTLDEKKDYYAKGRITVLRLDSLNRKTNNIETKYAPRLAGTTFEPLTKNFCKTAEEAYLAGKALQTEMRKWVVNPPVENGGKG